MGGEKVIVSPVLKSKITDEDMKKIEEVTSKLGTPLSYMEPQVSLPNDDYKAYQALAAMENNGGVK